MKLKFLDTTNNKFIPESIIEDRGYDYHLSVESDGSIIGTCWEETCSLTCIHLNNRGLIIQRYTEVSDSNGTEIYDGDKVELSEFSIFTNSFQKSEWIVKFRAGHWTINRFNESQDLFYVSHKLKVISDR